MLFRSERLSVHDGMAIGFWIGNGAHNLVLNCDAYRNHDDVSENRRGGNTDGFGFHGPRGSVGNVFRGCRAWFNSDDGFDFINSGEAAVAEDCWAFYNGFSPRFEPLADGNGFKAGGHAGTPVARLPNPIPRHVVRGCLAVRNKANGFYANHHIGGVDFIHNSAARNRANRTPGAEPRIERSWAERRAAASPTGLNLLVARVVGRTTDFLERRFPRLVAAPAGATMRTRGSNEITEQERARRTRRRTATLFLGSILLAAAAGGGALLDGGSR